MNIRIEYLTKNEAHEAMYEAEGNWSRLYGDLSPFYKKIRTKLIIEYWKLKDSHDVKNSGVKQRYTIDYLYGMFLYENIDKIFEGEINNRVIANIDFWIYISVYVIPDIVADRWGDQGYDHFYKMERRIWLSSIWWYIHLTWQGSREDTIDIIYYFNTDTLLNLVERPYVGFDIILTRSLMKNLSTLFKNNDSLRNFRDIFRAIMVQNTVYLETIEPLTFECVDDYTNMLIRMIVEESVDNE